MKTLITLTIPVILIALAPSLIIAQNNSVDQERIQRDLRIMERTLDELFTLRESSANQFNFSVVRVRIGGSAKGTYLPGFGVILTLPDRTSNAVRINTNESDQERTYFAEGEVVTEATIRDRMREFLTHYAPAIGQLQPDEQVMVLYGTDPANRGNFLQGPNIFRLDASVETNQTDTLIAMSVSRREMDAFRSGQISETEFLERIHTSVKTGEEVNRRADLDIFSGILETGLNESLSGREENRTVFSMFRKPTYLHLDTFGVIYQLELNLSPFILGRVGTQLNEAFQRALGAVTVQGYGLMPDSANWSGKLPQEQQEKIRQNREEARQVLARREQELSERQEEERENAHREIESLSRSIELYLDTVADLILDYGNTLQSLEPEHSLMISVSLNIPGRFQDESLPHRADLKITMSDLELFKRGTISREEARSRITEQSW